MPKDLPIATFEAYIYLWNWLQNQNTPRLHSNMAEWLEKCWKKDKHRMLLMAFREAGKSTIAGLFAAWLIYKNPNIRILVLAADHALAGKMVRNVKRIIEIHPLTAELKPIIADQWASDRFTVKRTLELRDPTMLAKGVMSNVTGSRADIVICDDVEVPNTSDSSDKREGLRERLGEIPYVLIAGGSQLYIGTPHDYYSIYADSPREEIGEQQVFLQSYERLSIPILDEMDNIAWPEKYTCEDIGQIKLDTGPNKFTSQMMLKPVNIMDGRLDADLLRTYTGEVEFDRITGKLYISGSEMAGASCWWDPAYGSAKGDDSVCAVVFGDPLKSFFIQHIEYIRTDKNSDIDEATQQARIVAEIAKKYYLPSVTIETNGIGKFLPGILRDALVEAHAPTRVNEFHSTKNKAYRILDSFDGVMAADRLRVHENVLKKTPFMMEMREWRPGSNKCKDDALDAVAGALKLQPDRHKRSHIKGGHSWMQASETHISKGDWEV